MPYPASGYLTPHEYLEIEVRARQKHEYFEGRMYERGLASFDHNIIVANLTRKMNVFTDGRPFDVFGSDMRVVTPQFDSFMYPDLTILCEEIIGKENGFDTLTNPTAVIEVMSASTRGYDTAFKFHFYRQILSLQEYILVDATRYFVQVNRRQKDHQWDTINIEDMNGVLTINSIQIQIPLTDIYRKVSFAEQGK